MGLVSKDKVELFMRLIDGDFPDYTKVIPIGNPNIAKLDHDELLQALRRVSFFPANVTKASSWSSANDKLSISANNPDLGEAVEEVEAEYKGKTIAIGFNARYFIDVLAVLGGEGEIEFELKDELSPSVIRKAGVDGYLYVLMPMRL